MDAKDKQIEELLKEIRARREKASEELKIDPAAQAASIPAPTAAPVEAAKAQPTPQPAVQAAPVPEKPAAPVAQQKAQTPAEEKPVVVEKETFAQLQEKSREALKKDAAAEAPSFTQALRDTVTFDMRSVLDTLKTEDAVNNTEQFDPINKNMLAPTIERGVDTALPAAENAKRTFRKAVQEDQQGTQYAEKHSIFTDDPYKPTYVPEEADADKPLDAVQEPLQTGAVILDAVDKRTEKKGVLNVKDNIDDNFREFFGNTVVIDRQSMEDKTKRQRKVKDFVFADDASGVKGGPVFEDEEAAPAAEHDILQDASDIGDAAEALSDAKSRIHLRTVLTGAFAGVLMLFGALAHLDILPGFISAPTVYFLLCAVLAGAAAAVNASDIIEGLKTLFGRRAQASALVSLSVVLSVVECVLLAFMPDSAPRAVCAVVSVFALFFYNMGLLNNATRVLDSFDAVNETEDKFACSVLDDQPLTRKIGRGLELATNRVILKRRTSFTDNYLVHAQNFDHTPANAGLVALAAAALSLVLGAVVFILRQDASAAVFTAALTAALAAPFTASLASAWPIGHIQNILSPLGAVIPGYSAADEVNEANCIVVTGREIFPKGNVMLHGIKTFERERVDKAILYAASVLIQSCDTMSHVFLNVIQNKTDMLYPVDSVEYESDLGFSFWVEKKRVLLGTRELLQAHDIDVPSRDYENRYTKTSTRDAIYLAVSGKLYAMFVISYAPNEAVQEDLRTLEEEGINIIVHTRDFNLNDARISKMFGIPRTMVTVVREDDVPELSRRTSYTKKASSCLTHVGSLTSFVSGMVGCMRVKTTLRLAQTLLVVSMAAGLVLAVAFALFELPAGLNVLSALLFQLLWLGVMRVSIGMRKL